MKPCKPIFALFVLLLFIGLTLAIPGGTFVHLFEWKWPDVARECEEFLGPKGYSAVQVSPPQEHIEGLTWWTRYQPVSYKITSRGGNREQFADMVRRCKKVGVDIYVDAVINHMSGVGRGRGVAGTEYSEYNYPGVPYSGFDFHYCERPNYAINNYNDRYEVRKCQLVGLADLAMEKDYVRGKISDFLNDLIGMGVAGFRIDAAKHMEPGDLYAISTRLNGRPYIFNEVIEMSPGEIIRASEYFGVGDATEFKYGVKLAEHIRDKTKIRYLETFGESWGFIEGSKAVVFVSNHDNERGHGGGGGVLTFRDGQLFELAHIFMLAWPYGYPKVMSSFEFGDDSDRGPPSQSPFASGEIKCGFNDPWKCQHRWTPIANMVKFRKAVGTAPVTNWWSNNAVIGFGRSDRAFVVINREDYEITETFPTSMQPGRYCNVIKGELVNRKCTDEVLEVGQDSRVQIKVPALSAAAIHIDALEGSDSVKANFKQLFIRGTFNNWDKLPMQLTRDHLWVAEKVSFDGNANPRFKFDVHGDWSFNFGDNNGNSMADQGGKDIGIPVSNVPVTIEFDDATKKYSVEPALGFSRVKEEL